MPFDCFLFNSFLALFLFVQIVFWFTYSLYTCLSTNFLIVCFLVCSVMFVLLCLFVVLRSFVCFCFCLFVTAVECQEQQGRQHNCDCFCFDDNITTETLYYKAYLKIKCFIAIKYKYKSSQLMTQCLHRLCLTSTRRT